MASHLTWCTEMCASRQPIDVSNGNDSIGICANRTNIVCQHRFAMVDLFTAVWWSEANIQNKNHKSHGYLFNVLRSVSMLFGSPALRVFHENFNKNRRTACTHSHIILLFRFFVRLFINIVCLSPMKWTCALLPLLPSRWMCHTHTYTSAVRRIANFGISFSLV